MLFPHGTDTTLNTSIERALTPVALASALVLTTTAPASAADAVYGLPAGTACAGSGLSPEVADPGRAERFLPDRDGLPRSVTAGRGNPLTFTSFGPAEPVEGESVTIRTGGPVRHTVHGADGVPTVTGTGHDVVLLFPGDEPAGDPPSTRRYVGKPRFADGPANGFPQILSLGGRGRGICAELS